MTHATSSAGTVLNNQGRSVDELRSDEAMNLARKCDRLTVENSSLRMDVDHCHTTQHELVTVLEECLEYFDDRADVSDDSEFDDAVACVPNTEMSLANDIRAALLRVK